MVMPSAGQTGSSWRASAITRCCGTRSTARHLRRCPTTPRFQPYKRRRLLRKPLLFDYHLICIPQRYRERHHLDGDADSAQLRAHFVRGHFKVRKTGIFWWSAYQRGDPKLGFVHKDYKLRLPEEVAA
jgi:hypothetical protein